MARRHLEAAIQASRELELEGNMKRLCYINHYFDIFPYEISS